MMAARRTLAEALAGPPPPTIPDVIERLTAIDAVLPVRDGVAWFTKLYLEVTKAVAATMKPGGFRDPRFLDRLDVVFANLYLDALRAYVNDPGSVPRGWAPLFEARRRRGIAPIQFALAGMNAHINRDLPVALVAVREELRLDLDEASPQHADYEKVNGLLARTETRVKRWFATGFVGVVDEALGKVDDRIAMWDVGRARDAAWVQAETLWALRRLPPLRSRYLATLDRVAGFAGRGLLVPLR